MKRKSLGKKLIALAITGIMLISLCSCGKETAGTTAGSTSAGTTGAAGTTAANSETVEKAKDLITITLLTSGASDPIPMPEKVAVLEEIKRVTGVKLEITGVDDAKYNVIVASGDLPDLIRVKNADLSKIVTGGNVIALDELVQNYGKDILANIPKAVDFSIKNWSNGQNKLYYLPVQGWN